MLRLYGRKCKCKDYIYEIGVGNFFLRGNNSNSKHTGHKGNKNLPMLRLKLLFKTRHNKPIKKTSHGLHLDYIKNSYNQQGKGGPVKYRTKGMNWKFTNK